MAVIGEYTARRGLQPSSTPQVQLSSAVSQELANVGGAVEDIAATFIQRQEQKENFKVENAYRRLKLDLENDLTTMAQTIPEGGDGFHDMFLTQSFKPKRDAFLASVPERLRPKFQQVLDDNEGADALDWSVRAATVERDEGYRWQKQEISLTHTQMANAIALDPEGYDNYLADGEQLINSSSLPTPEKDSLRIQWEETAQVAYLNKLLQDRPQDVLRELGADARQLSSTTQFAILSQAVQWQESSDNPDAVSPKGAVGLMQVMPATARDIAKALKDERFPADAPDAAVSAYLSNPVVNKEYGEEYLRQQLRAFATTRNPIETALVAYNAGPSVATRWVESGYDDKILSKETRDYKKAILASISPQTTKGNPKDVVFQTRGGQELGGDAVNPDLRGRVASAYSMLGIDKVRVNSARRSEAENKAVGGADESQHLDGNALDIDVAGMPINQRIELIKALSASGVTGIGVYANTIHADLGGRRAWGPSHGFETLPKWAKGVIGQHLQGTTPPPAAINARLASLPYDKRQAFTTQADQAITSAQAQIAKASAVDKVTVRRQMDNELATIRTTGVPTGSFDETRIATVLGEDDYMQFAARKDVAQRTYNAVSGMATMDDADLEQRLRDYQPIAGAEDFAAQQQVEAAVQKEFDRIRVLRAKSPDLAAMEYPEVKQAFDAVEQQMAAGTPEPKATQDFVKMMLEKQAEFNIKPEARAPIPSAWATEIGRSLTRVPEPAGRNLNEVRASIQAQYEALKEYFGEYTDEVITYSLSEYQGLSPVTADTISALMLAINKGQDPARVFRRVDRSLDQDQVNGFNLFDVSTWFPTQPPIDDTEVPSTEDLLRAAEENQ